MDQFVEKILAKLISMRTITDDVAANDIALDYIENFLAKRGMYATRFRFDGRGSLVATVRPGLKKPKVLLNAHVDVVPGENGLFTMRQKGDRLVGRGAYDMKFAIAAYMQLVDDLQGSLEDYNFGIMVTTDEEHGDRDGINGAEKLVKAGYLPEVCIVPDGGSGWNIETLAKGHWRFDLIASGQAAHGARPWEGDSASFKLVAALHDLKEHFREHGPLTDTLNIGKVHGGENFNQIPDAMHAWIEIRLSGAGSLKANKALVAGLCKKYGLTAQTRSVKAPLSHDLDNAFVSAFADSVEAICGAKPEGCISYGGSDAAHFSAAGVTCIVTRPAGGNLHGPDEWVSRQSLAKFVPILKNYLGKTAKVTANSVDTEAALV